MMETSDLRPPPPRSHQGALGTSHPIQPQLGRSFSCTVDLGPWRMLLVLRMPGGPEAGAQRMEVVVKKKSRYWSQTQAWRQDDVKRHQKTRTPTNQKEAQPRSCPRSTQKEPALPTP